MECPGCGLVDDSGPTMVGKEELCPDCQPEDYNGASDPGWARREAQRQRLRDDDDRAYDEWKDRQMEPPEPERDW